MNSGDEAQLRRLVALDAIRELPLRYARALERRDGTAMASLFAPHARFGAYGTGPDAVAALFEDSMRASLVTVVLVANHLIELDDDDHAHGEVWARGHALLDGEGYCEQLIRYDDRYERVDGSWRFLHRRHRLWFGVPADSPFDQAPADWPRRQVGVGDIPLADPTFAAWYRSARDEERT